MVSSKDVFACGVDGNSMRGRGIQSGDRLIVDPHRSANAGDIVLAQSGEDKVIRILRLDDNGPYLVAAARGYNRLRLTEEAVIIGVVIGWFRHPGKP